MTENQQNKVKIRLKLRSGEEFEAEGSPDFIEKQRAEFLQLIGKPAKSSGTDWAESGTGTSRSYRRPQPRQQTSMPAPFSQQEHYPNQQSSYPAPAITSSGFAAAEQIRPQTAPSISRETAPSALWEQITKIDDGLVVLRRKSRLLSPETAAILLIAAAKELLKESDGYSALALSKSLAKSGYGGGRLDRVLAGEMRQGSVKAAGSKRSRAYLLSDEGFARAFVLAGKIAGEWH